MIRIPSIGLDATSTRHLEAGLSCKAQEDYEGLAYSGLTCGLPSCWPYPRDIELQNLTVVGETSLASASIACANGEQGIIGEVIFGHAQWIQNIE